MAKLDVFSKTKTSIRKVKAFWREMMNAQDDTLRNQFAVEHIPLVRSTAQRVMAKLPNLVELDDLIQVGMIGLHKAMLAYDPKRRVRFTTFAPFYVRGAILDHLRESDWVPRLVRQRTRIITNAARALQISMGRSPTEQELADHLNLSPEDYAHVRKDSQPVSQQSLHLPRFHDSAGRTFERAVFQIDSRAADPTLEAERNSLKDFITRGFDRAESLILILYYYEQMSMKEIGVTLDISESRVSQLHSGIIARLKAKLLEKRQEFEHAD